MWEAYECNSEHSSEKCTGQCCIQLFLEDSYKNGLQSFRSDTRSEKKRDSRSKLRQPTGAEAMTCGERLKSCWHNNVLGLTAIPANCLMFPRSMHLSTDHCYPNDKQLYVSFSPKKDTGQIEAVGATQSCVEDMRKWPTKNNCCLMMIKKRIPDNWYQAPIS